MRSLKNQKNFHLGYMAGMKSAFNNNIIESGISSMRKSPDFSKGWDAGVLRVINELEKLAAQKRAAQGAK